MIESTERLWNRSFILCVLNNLFVFIYYFAMLAVLPIYIVKDLAGSIEEAGLALTLFLASSIALRPFSGMIIQKLGKKMTFRGSSTLFALFAFSYVFIDSMWTLLLVRFLHGIWFSILTTVAVPVANDFIPDDRKGEGMGYYVMSTNLGVVFGPLIALTVIHFYSFQVLFSLLAILISIGLVFSWLLKVPDQQKVEIKPNVMLGKKKYTIQDFLEPKVFAISGVALLTAFAYSSITSFITVYSESQQLLAYTSMFFILFAAAMLLVRPWVGKVYDRKGPSAVIVPSFIFFAIGLVIVTQVSDQWTLWLSAIFIGLGYGSLFPCLQTLTIQTVEKERMGHAISTFFICFDIGLAVGSVVMGFLIAQWSFEVMYFCCAVLVVITLLLYMKYVPDRDDQVV